MEFRCHGQPTRAADQPSEYMLVPMVHVRGFPSHCKVELDSVPEGFIDQCLMNTLSVYVELGAYDIPLVEWIAQNP